MEIAAAVAWFGALGLVVAGLVVVALKVVQPEEVPGYVRVRIRWWTAHNPAFMVGSAVLGAVGLVGLVVF
ncbi:hypothetical protein BJ973_000661 [Actinoplanes tereljensis]|uniref:Uncharacterized protein n=1 Tax=Paractinoplanes tereljensis TaxID=571912 RepID=A0A919NQ17_9ACTN|nr:hypothetical protein [Actinoplanes tereljensis]GIF22981.1 hypothetical protein Ate02nite_57110 [Actinoplanes tereljensis]